MIVIDTSQRIDQLKIEIEVVRKKLEEAWDTNGKTDQAVLMAGEKFDQLINEYGQLQQLTDNSQCDIM